MGCNSSANLSYDWALFSTNDTILKKKCPRDKAIRAENGRKNGRAIIISLGALFEDECA